MRQLKRIIVGHDLGVGGEVALGSAVALANRCGAALRLVHVVEPLEAYQQKTGVKLQALVASLELARLQVEYEVRKGKPFVEIIIASRAWLAALIVVGGASRTEEPFLGSTSERILRKAMVPVMVTKKPLSSEAKTFLVPTDFSSCARKAAEEALMLAKYFSARIVFFHVLGSYPSYTIAYAHDLGVSVPISSPSPEEIEPEWEAFLSGLPLEKVDWKKCTVTAQESPAPAQEMTTTANQEGLRLQACDALRKSLMRNGLLSQPAAGPSTARCSPGRYQANCAGKGGIYEKTSGFVD